MRKDKIDNYDRFIIVLFALGFSLWFIAISGCNAYKGIAKRGPETDKEKNMLANRFLQTFPSEEGTVKEGKIIVLPDSNEYWKNAAAISKAKKDAVVLTLKTKYVDTCLSVFDRFEEGYNEGFDVGYSDGKSKCAASTRKTDTLLKDSPQTLAKLYLLNEELTATKNELREGKRDYNELKTKTGSLKWSLLHIFTFWKIWVLLVLFGIWIFRKPLLMMLA